MLILRAVIREVLRWRPPTPFGVPHFTDQDRVYNGYHIKKDEFQMHPIDFMHDSHPKTLGSIIMANQLAISRDPSEYPDPEEFRPERWLEPGWPTYREPLTRYPDIRNAPAFEHGIRSCPGQELAKTEVCTLISSIAWAFDVKRKEGRPGAHLPWYETAPWIITRSDSFPLDIQVRNERKAEVLRRVAKNSDEPSNFWVADLGIGRDLLFVLRP
jgi:cytochrome P450